MTMTNGEMEAHQAEVAESNVLPDDWNRVQRENAIRVQLMNEAVAQREAEHDEPEPFYGKGADDLPWINPEADQRPFVAEILDDDGSVYDRAWTWETGQNFAQQGYVVRAIADDAYMTIEKAQALYDYERACFRDCFGMDDA